MADRYWVGGAGNWTDNTNHWSATSGGSPGVTVPSSSDDVFVDVNSGASGSIAMNTTVNCKSFTMTKSFDISSNGGITVFGSADFDIATWTHSGTLTLRAPASTTSIFKPPNNMIGNFSNVTINGQASDSVLKLGKKLRSLVTLTLTQGTLDTDSWDIENFGFFVSTGSATRLLQMRGATFTILNSTTATVWNISGSNINVEKGASNIVMTTSGSGTYTFNGGGQSYHVLNLGTGALGQFTLTGSNSFNTFEIPAISGGRTVTYQAGTTQTITTLNAIGTSSRIITFNSSSNGSKANLNVGQANVDYVAVRDNDASTGTTIYDPNGTNNGNNTNWFFTSNPSQGSSTHRAAILGILDL